MAFNINQFLTPKIISLGIFSLVLLIVITTLFVINKRLKRKVNIKEIEEEEEDFLKIGLNELKNSGKSPEILLNSIDLFARNFFIENFKLNPSSDYAEMKRIFREKKKNKAAIFCHKILEILYAGERIKKERINDLLNDLEGIIEEERPKLKGKNIEEIKRPSIAIKPRIIKIEKEEIKPQQQKAQLPQFLLPHLPEADRITNELSQIDEEQIRDAYKELQRIFKQIYTLAEISKNKENIRKLEEFRDAIIKRVNEYADDPFKITELAQEIANGAKLIKSINV